MVLDRLLGGQLVIEAVAQEGRAEPEREPGGQPEQAVLDRLGRTRRGRRLGGRDQDHVARVDRAADLHLGQLLLQDGLLIEQRRRRRRTRVVPERAELMPE
jgi:hypothetical protein